MLLLFEWCLISCFMNLAAASINVVFLVTSFMCSLLMELCMIFEVVVWKVTTFCFPLISEMIILSLKYVLSSFFIWGKLYGLTPVPSRWSAILLIRSVMIICPSSLHSSCSTTASKALDFTVFLLPLMLTLSNFAVLYSVVFWNIFGTHFPVQKFTLQILCYTKSAAGRPCAKRTLSLQCHPIHFLNHHMP